MILLIAGLAGALVCFGIGVIVYDMNRFVVTPYEIRSRKIKEKFTFVMLSDLHNKSYGKKNERLIREIFRLSPDAVVGAGDLYTSTAGAGSENARALLEGLAGHFPIYLANGNHERKTMEFPEEFEKIYERYMGEIQGKATPLLNERVILPGPNLNLCGLDMGLEFFKHIVRPEMPENYLEDCLGKADPDRFQILIAHNPIYFQEYADWGADLVLSGHIHGGIVRLPFLGGVISPAIWLFPHYDGGRYELGESVMLLGRGLGTHTIPVRMWNPGEVVLVTLLPKE